VKLDSFGNIFVADAGNHRIRKINLVGNTYVVSTIAGSISSGCNDGSGWSTSGSSASNVATFNNSRGIVLDSFGNIFVADTGNHCIRKITLVGNTYVVTTIAGSISSGFNDGSGWSLLDSSASNVATFNFIIGIALDSFGNIFVADHGNHRIRKVRLVGNTYVVSTIAGSISRVAGYQDGSGWSLPDSSSSNVSILNAPWGIAVDATGNIIISEWPNGVRKISLIGNTYVVSTIVSMRPARMLSDGSGWTILGNSSANSVASINSAAGLWVDSYGTILVTDWNNNSIRSIASSIRVSQSRQTIRMS
jgi:hypothetical protein